MLLYQNLANPVYVKAVFGEEGVAAVFGKERAGLAKDGGMSRKERDRLLEKAQEMFLAGGIPETPYTGAMNDQAWSQRVAIPPIGKSAEQKLPS